MGKQDQIKHRRFDNKMFQYLASTFSKLIQIHVIEKYSATESRDS